MRVDRALTLIASRAAEALGANRGIARLPVFMYHSVASGDEGRAAYYRTSTDPLVFAEQMRILREEGYTGVTLSDGLRAIQHAQPGTTRPVVLTFDDGYCDFLNCAVPVLQRHGFNATMYLPTAFIGDGRRQFKGRDCLTWTEVAELHRAGFEFGSHTVTHPRLVDLPWNQIRDELAESKRAIELRLNTSVTTFAYPYAFPQHQRRFACDFRDALRACGYRTAVTTRIGHVAAGDDLLSLRRLPANSADDPALFRAKLQGFYNWMAGPQLAAKTLRRASLR